MKNDYVLRTPFFLVHPVDTLLYIHSPPPYMLLQRVLVPGEVRHGPGGQGHVYLVDVLGVGAGQRGRRSPVESPVEGQDGEVGGAGGSVHHAALHGLLAEGFPAPHLAIIITIIIIIIAR